MASMDTPLAVSIDQNTFTNLRLLPFQQLSSGTCKMGGREMVGMDLDVGACNPYKHISYP